MKFGKERFFSFFRLKVEHENVNLSQLPKEMDFMAFLKSALPHGILSVLTVTTNSLRLEKV